MDPQHLKVKEFDISLTKNYCITTNINTINSIHIFLLRYRFSGLMNLKATAIFDKALSKMIESTFSLPAFLLACKKSGYIFRSYMSPMTRLATPIFWTCPPNKKNSWDTANLRVHRPDLLNLLLKNSSFRNYTIWLAESILAYISEQDFSKT